VPINYAALEKKVAKSNSEINDPKKSLDPKAWLKRGDIMISVFEVDLEETYEGMNPVNLVLFYKNPNKGSETLNDKNYEVYSYDRIKFFFENNSLAMWEKTKYAFEDPLLEAYNSLVKTCELDQAGKLSDKTKESLTKLKNQLKIEGINSYYRGFKDIALRDFEMVLAVNKLPILKGEIDTMMIQYAGIIARELKQTEKAIKLYKELAEIDNQPNTFLLIKEDYLSMKDTINAIITVEKAFKKYPDSLNVVINLVDLYIRSNRIDDGLKTIDAALAHNPEKGEFYYWKGRLQLSATGDDRIERALESYNTAVQKSPDLFYAYYDIGFIYFLQGQDLFARAGEEKDKLLREKMVEVGKENYMKSLPNLEKALELNISNKEIKKETLDTIKRVYYKLEMMDKYEAATEQLKSL